MTFHIPRCRPQSNSAAIGRSSFSWIGSRPETSATPVARRPPFSTVSSPVPKRNRSSRLPTSGACSCGSRAIRRMSSLTCYRTNGSRRMPRHDDAGHVEGCKSRFGRVSWFPRDGYVVFRRCECQKSGPAWSAHTQQVRFIPQLPGGVAGPSPYGKCRMRLA